MIDWNELYRVLASKIDYIRPNPPASQKQIIITENKYYNDEI